MGPIVTYPYFPLDGPWCVNNALINALKKLMLRQLYYKD